MATMKHHQQLLQSEILCHVAPGTVFKANNTTLRPIIHKMGGCFGKVRAVDGKLKSRLEWPYTVEEVVKYMDCRCSLDPRLLFVRGKESLVSTVCACVTFYRKYSVMYVGYCLSVVGGVYF